MSETGTAAEPGGPTELRRVMGPGLLLLFVVGDILGTGVYALTGTIADEVGGAAWAPFLVAFTVALITAFSYLELVTKYPRAAGAALYTHKAFGVHFLTFIVAFAVMSSGITSASTAARAFASNFAEAFDLTLSDGIGITVVAAAFILLVAAVNFRGVGESVKANVVLTCVELSGLLIVIFVGAWALGGGDGDWSRAMTFEASEGGSITSGILAATAIALFAMIGFEDAVNMAEETKDPVRIFPKILLGGICLTGLIYILVAVSSVALVPPSELGEGDTPLLKVVEAGAPGFPIGLFAVIAMFAVANSALINMLMASRLLYGMARERVLPGAFGKVHPARRTPWLAIIFTTLLALGLITFVGEISELGGTTSLLLLAVFTVVNICVLVLRRDPVEHDHFRTPTVLPVVGALSCAFLVSPLTPRPGQQYVIAGILLAIGAVLWLITYLTNPALRSGDVDYDELTSD